MSAAESNHEQRIAELEKIVAILRKKTDALGQLPDLMEIETAGRVDMWIKLWQVLTMLIKSHNNITCLIADSSLVSNPEERREMLKFAAELENGCALIEKIFGSFGGSPDRGPTTPPVPPIPPGE